MHWIILGIIAASLVFLAVYNPKIAFSGLFVLLCAVIIILNLNIGEKHKNYVDIPISKVVFDNVKLTNGYRGGYIISGLMINNSVSADILEVTLKVTLDDCLYKADLSEDCFIIGPERFFLTLKVPSGQSKKFSESIHFSGPQSREISKWHYEIVKIRGQLVL